MRAIPGTADLLPPPIGPGQPWAAPLPLPLPLLAPLAAVESAQINRSSDLSLWLVAGSTGGATLSAASHLHRSVCSARLVVAGRAGECDRKRATGLRR